MRPIDRLLAATALDHDDVLTLGDLRAVGLSTSARYRRRKSGLLVPLGPRTTAFAGHRPTWRSLLAAGLADLGSEAVVGAWPSAALHRLDGCDREVVAFVVPRAQRRRRTVGPVRSTSALPRIDTTTVEGLRALSATRTIIELAADLADDELGVVLASALRRGLTSIQFLRRRHEALRSRGRPGSGRVERLLGDGPVESWLERRFLRLLRKAGLPEPRVQRRFRLGNGAVARVDFAFEPTPVLIEVGGKQGYLDPAERRRKERRRNQLQLQGKIVYFFATEDIVADGLGVVRTVRDALAEHSALLI